MADTKQDTRWPLDPDDLEDLALSLLSILKARRRVLDLLRPYRPLAAQPDLN